MGQIKIPRITTAQRTALTLDVGELVYDTTNGGVYKGDGATAGGVSVGGSGTVTSVTGSSPVVSSGGVTPAISIPVATTSVNGYLSSTDWTTFNNKGTGTVTSVAASVPTFLSVSGSPITTSGTLAVTLSGTALPVANGGTGVTTSTGSGNNVLSTSPVFTTPNIGSATGSISGNAATVTTNANLTGHITSVGNAAVLGSFTSAQLGAALTDETGTGVNVFATSPTLVTPILGSASATALTFSSTTVSGLTINKLTTTQRQALTPVKGDVVYDTTIGTTCTYNGTFWEYSKEYYVTASVSTTVIAASTITGLTTFILEANSTYNINGQFLIGCNNTGGVKFGNTLPAGAVSLYYITGISTAGTLFLQTASSNGALSATGINRVNGTSTMIFGGLITTAATAGTVDMQFASATATQTSTIYGQFSIGYQSKITLTKIA